MYFDDEDEGLFNPEVFHVVHRKLCMFFSYICTCIEYVLLKIIIFLLFSCFKFKTTVWFKCPYTHRRWNTYQKIIRIESTTQGNIKCLYSNIGKIFCYALLI